jgi:hypothetical protein
MYRYIAVEGFFWGDLVEPAAFMGTIPLNFVVEVMPYVRIRDRGDL